MYIVQVHVHVNPEQVDSFINVTIENAMSSTSNEPGIIRFDVMQFEEDPSRFELLEVYRTRDDSIKHKETSHYKRWREIAEPLMAEPRTRAVYRNIFPSE
jgi:(4S)-4-hydroxy-5-phosphonooxypentane-2,3-dione isomerase